MPPHLITLKLLGFTSTPPMPNNQSKIVNTDDYERVEIDLAFDGEGAEAEE